MLMPFTSEPSAPAIGFTLIMSYSTLTPPIDVLPLRRVASDVSSLTQAIARIDVSWRDVAATPHLVFGAVGWQGAVT